MTFLPRLIPTFLLAALLPNSSSSAQTGTQITVSTAKSSLRLFAANDGRLYQLSYGAVRNGKVAMPRSLPAREDEFHPPAGNGYIFEPALQAVHADGNTSTELAYVSHETVGVDDNVTVTPDQVARSGLPFFRDALFQSLSQRRCDRTVGGNLT